MAKKKSVKKVKRNSKKKRNSSVKIGASTRRDFEVFAKGVERLEELRAELNNLNTKGYEQEAASIRSKLKNVSYIPQIEREIKDLKAKLSGTYKKKVSDAHKDILKKVSDLKKSVPNHSGIHRKIRELEKHIPDKEKLGRKIRSIEKNVELVKNVPKMQRQIRDFKEFVDNKKKEDIRKAEMLKKLDPNINFLINDKFNLSLSEIKAELANQVNNKETVIENQLQEDFHTKIKNFERKYYLLEKDLEKKYRDKLRDSFQREVKNRFNKTLNERVGNIKIRLIRDNNRRLENERKNLRALKEKKIRELKESHRRFSQLHKNFREKVEAKMAQLKKLREETDKEKSNLNELYRVKLAKEKERLKLKDSRLLKNHRSELSENTNRKIAEIHKKEDIRLKTQISILKKEEAEKLKELKNSSENLKRLRRNLKKEEAEKIKKLKGSNERLEKTRRNFVEKYEKKLSQLKKLNDETDRQKSNLNDLYKKKLAKEKERLKLKDSKLLKDHRKKLNVAASKRLKEKKKINSQKIKKIIDDEKKIVANLKKSQEKLDLLRKKLIENTNKKIAEINKEKNTKLKNQVNILNKERRDKLNEISKIKKALIKRKKDLDESNVKWLSSVEAKMRAEEGKKLIDSIDKKSFQLTEEFNGKLKNEIESLRKHKDEEILMHKSLLDKKMNRHLTEHVKDVNKKYADKVLTHNRQIAKIKERLSNESGTLSNRKNILASLKDSLDVRVRKLKANEENYRREVMSQLELEKQAEVEVAVKKRSVEIRSKLKRNFDNRLKLELKAKQAEFDKRKSELALEIQEKAKVLFE